MTAKEAMTALRDAKMNTPAIIVEPDMPLIEVLPRLLDSPGREIGVGNGEDHTIGVINSDSMLEGLGRLISARDDCSVVTLECSPEEYSASMIARAVEDSDANLVDLLTSPAEDGKIYVTLRISHRDPSAAIRSLERYEFKVVEAHGAGSQLRDAELSAERLLALQTLLNV